MRNVPLNPTLHRMTAAPHVSPSSGAIATRASAPRPAPRPAPREPRLRLNVIADTVSTYLTLISALILPVLLLVWVRSFLVNDRIYHAEGGLAVVTGVANGELAVWAGPTFKNLDVYEHRSRQSNWGQSARRTFQRLSGKNHVWFLGFGYAQPQALPWRSVPLTGKGVAVCVPLWFPVLIVGVLPFRLLARNMQSSKDFLAQREAEREAAGAASSSSVPT